MLEGTDFWTTGEMHLWLNNQPAHVYVPTENVKSTYETLQSRLSKQGSIPIGIDHLADNIIEANPILKKLDLHHVGEITKITYANDAITIAEAKITNPLIRDLYEAGELEMVSIVANSTTSECPQDYDYIINSTDITRVDIVEKGACPTCNIPKPTDSSETVVYARYSINEMEEEPMSENELTLDAIKNAFKEEIAPIDEKLAAMEARIDKLENPTPEGNDGDNDDEKVKEMEARIAELQKETATAKVDNLIAAGKILPAQKDSAVTLCAADAEQFDAMYKDAPVIVDLDKRESLHAGDADGDGDGLSEDDELIEALNAKFSGDE